MVEDLKIVKILEILREHGKMSISKLFLRSGPISYYKVKLEYVPLLLKRGDVIVTKNGDHTYVELTERGKK